jgi:hypothetical protein
MVPLALVSLYSKTPAFNLSVLFLKSPRSRGFFFVFIVIFLYNLRRIKV